MSPIPIHDGGTLSSVFAFFKREGTSHATVQKENASDRELTQKIRHALMQDNALSSYAHNVKVIVQYGQVTLKGPVRSENEKRTVETKLPG